MPLQSVTGTAPYKTIAGRTTELKYDSKTGAVEWVETGITAIGTNPIFKNGQFTPSGKSLLQTAGLSEKQELENIKSKITQVSQSSGGTKPSWLTSSTPSTAPTGGSGNVLNTIGGIVNAVGDPLGAIDSIAEQFDSKGDSFLKSIGILKYPENVLEQYQDVLRIIQYRYQPTTKEIFTDPQKTLTQGIQRTSAKKDLLTTIYLPIPSGASDSNSVSWGPSEMNALTAAATGAVGKNMPGALAAMGIGAGVSKYAGGSGKLGAQAGILGLLGIQALGTGGSPNVNTSVGTGVLSQILNMAGFEVSPESILARAGGFVPNNNQELLFNSPNLRSFTFSYRLSPRSSREAKMVRQIIRSFKQGMAARKQASTDGQTSTYFLGTPNVFELEYLSNGKSISGMNKFKTCALTSFSVNYAPEGPHIAYEGGQPATYQITMGFSELEPIYESDYNETKGNRDKDLFPVNANDIGY